MSSYLSRQCSSAAHVRGVSRSPTPLVALDFGHGLWAFAKLEGFNKARSHKERAARAVIAALRNEGLIGCGRKTLLLSSSGRAARAFAESIEGIEGAELKIISDALSPPELLADLAGFAHVETIVINEPDQSGSHLNARLRRIAELQASHPDSITLDQYSDPRFPQAYLTTLVPEVIDQAGGNISAVFLPTGTGALARSFDLDKCLHRRSWKIVPVDAEGSALFRKPPRGVKRHFSGYGNARPTAFIEACGSIERPIFVPDLAVARVARWLLQQAGLLVGPSSAAVAAAFLHAAFIDHPALIGEGMPVLIFPDDGAAYTNSLFNDVWLNEHGMGRAVA